MPNKKYPYQNLSLCDMEGEEWVDLPHLDGAYRISNFGRIKAIRRWVELSNIRGYWLREKILKCRVRIQYISKGKHKLYRLTAQASFEAKKHSISIARMVYFLFVKKFQLEDRSLFVCCKDGNAFNINPQNLFLTTSSASITKAYQNNRRKRESFGNAERPITQYALDGRKIRTYPSLTLAANAVSISPASISDIVGKRDGLESGFIWRYGNRGDQPLRISKSIKRKLDWQQLHNTKVTQYNLEGNKIKEHPNIRAAARAMKAQTFAMTKAVTGKAHTCRGYYWKLGKGPSRIDILPILEKRKEKHLNSICRRIAQFDREGNKINTYRSTAEAAKAIGTHNANIHNALKSGGSCKKFKWQYVANDKTVL